LLIVSKSRQTDEPRPVRAMRNSGDERTFESKARRLLGLCASSA
jgi:hypothetical protein